MNLVIFNSPLNPTNTNVTCSFHNFMIIIDSFEPFLDSMGGGAWPFLVGVVICLVNSVNERDYDRLKFCYF